MRTPITGEEFDHALATFRHAAFRLEQQPVYAVSYEADNVAAFLAGDPQPPGQVPALADWFDQVRAHTVAGRTMTRVRIHDEPPTDYQRWIQWLEPWNIAAGEVMYHLGRTAARTAGLTADLGDFWLIDDEQVILMTFDQHGNLVDATCTDEAGDVSAAHATRDRAIEASRPVPAA
jgi:hypothetical protein